MKLTNKKALELDGQVVVLDNMEFIFSASIIKADGNPIVSELVIDAYVDGDWDDELSSTYHVGDIIENEPWLN